MNNNINSKPPVYDPAQVQPMRDELTSLGFEEVTTPQLVEEALSQKNNESILVFINSVCGCAAGSARPGVTLALQNKKIPHKFITAFAGQERDAIDYLREKYLNAFPPSSPCMALFKNGELLYMMPRHHIEGNSPEEVADILKTVFNEHCTKEGPAISEEAYAKIVFEKACGSSMHMN
jgi:putative YphP/YqiW family bacilliredoxin